MCTIRRTTGAQFFGSVVLNKHTIVGVFECAQSAKMHGSSSQVMAIRKNSMRLVLQKHRPKEMLLCSSLGLCPLVLHACSSVVVLVSVAVNNYTHVVLFRFHQARTICV